MPFATAMSSLSLVDDRIWQHRLHPKPQLSSSSLLFLLCLFLVIINLKAEVDPNVDRQRELANLHCDPGCLHNSTCQFDAKAKQPACVCAPPDEQGVYFRGRSCQTKAVRCSSAWWCENGGTCVEVEGSSSNEFTCDCPATYQGSKCQTPVVPCSGASGLWCANGGVCLFSSEANTTICQCPSTHSGAICQTLVEPQEFGPLDQLPNFTSPLQLPPDASLVTIQDERVMYFEMFFGILFALILIWIVALCFVHNAGERRRASFKSSPSLPLPPTSLPLYQLPSPTRPPSSWPSSSSSFSGGQRRFVGSISLGGSAVGNGMGLGLQADRVVRGKLPVVEVGPSRPTAAPHGSRHVATLRVEERLAARQRCSQQEEEGVGCSDSSGGEGDRLGEGSPFSRQGQVADLHNTGDAFEGAGSSTQTEMELVPIPIVSSSRRRDSSSSPLAPSLRERSPPSLSLCLDTTYNSLAQEDDRTHM